MPDLAGVHVWHHCHHADCLPGDLPWLQGLWYDAQHAVVAQTLCTTAHTCQRCLSLVAVARTLTCNSGRQDAHEAHVAAAVHLHTAAVRVL